MLSAALVTSFVIALVHKEYIVSCGAFVFPMLLSAMFNDRKLLNMSLYASLGILSFVSVVFIFDGTGTLGVALNLLILFGFVFDSYLCGILAINFFNLNHKMLEAQAQHNSKLRDDVLRDQMTGLYDHGAFVSDLNQLIEDEDASETFCLAMIDLDDFKRVNDTYGHDAGDEVLIFFADALRKFCGKIDVPYRYGGEEFAILFHKKGIDKSYFILKMLLEYVRQHSFDFSSSPVTFSAGLKEYSAGESFDSLFDAVDETLYSAKKQGKNRILKQR